MKTLAKRRMRQTIALACLLIAGIGWTQDARTVIGPSNLELKEGADALLAGDAEEGVRLTLLGLQRAPSRRERHTGWSNLCAGYVMLEQLDTALEYCNKVLAESDRHWRAYSNRALVYVHMRRFDDAEQDLQKGEALAPNARTLKAVRAMLLDAIKPVAPTVVIDDRRQPARDERDE